MPDFSRKGVPKNGGSNSKRSVTRGLPAGLHLQISVDGRGYARSVNFKCIFGERLFKALKVSNTVLKAELDKRRFNNVLDLIIETEVR